MRDTIDVKQNLDGSYSQAPCSVSITGDIGALAQYGDKPQNEIENFVNRAIVATNSLNQATINFENSANRAIVATNSLNQATINFENANQRYWNAEFNRQSIVNNETNRYNTLLQNQNNLFQRINFLEIQLWRYKKEFFFRANSGQLISGDKTKIEQELSNRYGVNVCIVNDLNDVLQNIYEIKVDTTFIAINSISVVEEEIFDFQTPQEVFQSFTNIVQRNLLAYTRFLKKRILSADALYCSPTSSILHYMTEPYFNFDLISGWIKNIGVYKDSILLLVSNQDVSEDIILKKVIKPLFNTGIFETITEDMLKNKSFAEITHNKLFLHINQIPTDKENQKKLKELIISIVINKSIQADGCTIPTQAKVIVTLDEPHLFFKDCIDIAIVLFIKTMDEIVAIPDLHLHSSIQLYQVIENSLDYFSGETSMEFPESSVILSQKERYIELLQDKTELIDVISDTGLPILDPYSDSYEKIIPNTNRFKHTYIIANQGYGKSQLITTLICRDIERNDCSVVLLDPHGDLAQDLFKIIKDKERLVYIDFYLDGSVMPTINLFDAVEHGNEDSIYSLTQLIISVFKNISSEDKLTGIMENTVENCMSVMSREGGGSFWELYLFLGGTGSKDWLKIGKNSPNPIEADYFNNQFEKDTPTRDAVRRRLSKLIRDPKFSAFMNRQSTLNLEQLVNTKGKIIIFNIASGRMPNTYQYYMKFLIGYLQLIALKRVSIEDKEKRTYTQLYLDEFHLFLDKSNNLQEILTGARKYRMFLTFAHQSTAQIESSNLKEIVTTIPTRYFIGNVANKTLEALNKALNIKLDNPEKQLSGEFYFQEDSNEPFQIRITDRFLDGKEDISSTQLEEHKRYQLKTYYRPINQNTSSQQPTEDDLKQMVQRFKDDIKSVLSSKISIELSCLNNLSKKIIQKSLMKLNLILHILIPIRVSQDQELDNKK